MLNESTDYPAQTIETLSDRYRQFNEQKIQAGTNLENAQEQLNKLTEKAMQDYDTDNLEELKKILEDRKRQNEEDRANYQKRLDNIKTELEGIDNKYNSIAVR